MLLAVLGSAGSVAMAFAPSAAAHGLLDHEEASVPGQVRAALGNGVVPGAEGLYEVPIADGAELTTHGPDPVLAAGPATTGPKGGPRRPLACTTGRHTRFLYARPGRAKGNAKKSKRRIQRAAKEANALIDRSSIAEGGPHADLYTKCTRHGKVAVATFRSSALDYQALVRKAQRAGFESTEVDYVILSPRRDFGSCGVASYSPDSRLSSINVSNLIGGYAVVYRPCWAAEGVAHEIGHLQGAVQYAAPYSTGFGRHCFDELDAMCYVPDGGDLHQTGPVGRCPEMRFDCGGDTYFDSAPEPGEWLEAHWNLGSPLNSYMRFSD